MPYGWGRSAEAGAWSYRLIIWLTAAGILLGLGLIVWSLLSGGRGGAT